MKKLMILTIMFVALGLTSYSQDVFNKGNQGINAGIGLGPGYYGSYGFGFGINGSYEYAIVEVPMGSSLKGVVGVGGGVGICFSSDPLPYDNGKYHYTNWSIMARGTYHFIFMDKLDPYAGLTLGYMGYSWKWKDGDYSPEESSGSGGSFEPGFFVGARYFFTDSFGVFAELGYQINVIEMGVAFKIE
jgi:hypothetical protein